jgi:hypothetical protein
MSINIPILQKLEQLEEELRKGIRQNRYFGDSYICNVADKINEIQKMYKIIYNSPRKEDEHR